MFIKVFVNIPEAPEVWAVVFIDNPKVLYVNLDSDNTEVIRIVPNT